MFVWSSLYLLSSIADFESACCFVKKKKKKKNPNVGSDYMVNSC